MANERQTPNPEPASLDELAELGQQITDLSGGLKAPESSPFPTPPAAEPTRDRTRRSDHEWDSRVDAAGQKLGDPEPTEATAE